MYTIVVHRHGKVEYIKAKSKPETHRLFNIITDNALGYCEAILDQDNVIIRSSSILN